jgi:hypothetical protein
MSTIVAPARPYWTSAALWLVRGLLALAYAERGQIASHAETL